MSITERRRDAARPGPTGDRYAHPRTTKLVLRWLAEQPRDDNGDITASQRDIAEGTGIPLSTVRRAMRRLLDHGDLALTELGTGYPHSSRYRLGTDHADASPITPVA